MSNSTQPPQPWGAGTGQTFASNYSAGFNFNPKPESKPTNPFDTLSNSNLIAPGLADILKSLPQEQQTAILPSVISNASIMYNTDIEENRTNKLISRLLDRQDNAVTEERKWRALMTPGYNMLKAKENAKDREERMITSIATAALNRPSTPMQFIAPTMSGGQSWNISMPKMA